MMTKVLLEPHRGIRANCGTKDGRDYAFVTVKGTCADGKPAHVTFNNREAYNGILAGRSAYDKVTVEGEAKPHTFTGRDGKAVEIMTLRDPMPVDLVVSTFTTEFKCLSWDELMGTATARVSKVTENTPNDNVAF